MTATAQGAAPGGQGSGAAASDAAMADAAGRAAAGPSHEPEAAHCIIPGCGKALDYGAASCQRNARFAAKHSICVSHLKEDTVSINGQQMRWCQKCSRYARGARGRSGGGGGCEGGCGGDCVGHAKAQAAAALPLTRALRRRRHHSRAPQAAAAERVQGAWPAKQRAAYGCLLLRPAPRALPKAFGGSKVPHTATNRA